MAPSLPLQPVALDRPPASRESRPKEAEFPLGEAHGSWLSSMEHLQSLISLACSHRPRWKQSRSPQHSNCLGLTCHAGRNSFCLLLVHSLTRGQKESGVLWKKSDSYFPTSFPLVHHRSIGMRVYREVTVGTWGGTIWGQRYQLFSQKWTPYVERPLYQQ